MSFINRHIILIVYLLFVVNVLFYVSFHLYSFVFAEEVDAIFLSNRKILAMEKQTEENVMAYLGYYKLYFVERSTFPDTIAQFLIVIDTDVDFSSVDPTQLYVFDFKGQQVGPLFCPLYNSSTMELGSAYEFTDPYSDGSLEIVGSELPTESDRLDNSTLGRRFVMERTDGKREYYTYTKKYILYLGRDREGNTGPIDIPHYRIPVEIMFIVWRS